MVMKIFTSFIFILIIYSISFALPTPDLDLNTLTIKVVDSKTKKLIPSRVYLSDSNGKHYFAQSVSTQGKAIKYEKTNWSNKSSFEFHTSISAHPAKFQIPPGKYVLTVERGKEYFTNTLELEVMKDQELTVHLKRWIDMNSKGWYSGETHVHRTIAELPTLVQVENLNAAFPLPYWVTKSGLSPTLGDKSLPKDATGKRIHVDATHVIHPRNTEYEIFSVGKKSHTLGAVFIINHKEPLTLTAPPVRPIAEEVRRQGALLELDKHNWPWSMAIVPIMNVDLYELANNHHWRTEFAFKNFAEKPAPYMNIETDGKGFSEKGWTDFGFQNYYALLNCGFRMRPTAGSASGVHPVPLGFGRVYVHLDKPFTIDRWLEGLNKGQSFVTTGPMLECKLNGEYPGGIFKFDKNNKKGWNLEMVSTSSSPVSGIEIIRNGRLIMIIDPQFEKTPEGAFRFQTDLQIHPTQSTWYAVRTWQKLPNNRWRFAHSAPFHIQVGDTKVHPRKVELDYLIQRVQSQIDRSRGIISTEALKEYEEALKIYKAIPTKG